MASAISLSGLKKTFRTSFTLRRKTILHGVDLEIEEGKVFGFLGPNGAGKTTTIKILVGLVRASEGTASVLGKPAGSAEAMQQVGFLPENPYFYEYLNPEESLRFYGSLFGMGGARLRQKVEHLLEEFDLARVRHQRVRTFSKGMRQRLGMAQALIAEPRLAILDEPQSGLDPIGRHQIKSAIHKMRDAGVTVFFSSHVLADVEDLCDDIGLLIGGRLTQTGPLHKLLDTQSQRFELQFSGVTPEVVSELKASGLHLTSRAELVQIQVEKSEDVGSLLDQVRARGGQIVSIQPHRESLEDYFVRMAQRETKREAP